ncbi:hypothetical protein FHS95_002011 [Sphingomonas naasensis]|uniref:DUF2264 domain-containing protein n=1 Tax=Sphingomonas naasensis TaxID=1344951 RepID=A0A4S1WME5_9SPHN|nr:DUF2264 domain-containing protein [Sphingomonas naasensis]NIJ20319.1 hypothetical protein [Sphingomonas naasensis]TGX44441.1 DUF2264 domain-containing protein [Sphingomonas naasensis]
MERRRFLASALATGTLAATAPAVAQRAPAAGGAGDRAYMLDILARMAEPVLGPMSEGKLQTAFAPELSPSWDGRNPKVAYLECFGRLISGIAPWLALPDDETPEGRLRAKLRRQALASYVHSVDPASPDYLLWRAEGQPLVDSAYFTNALLRAPKQLWEPLDATTKKRVVAEIQGLRRVPPPYTNWLLFAAMNEAFLLSIGAQWDPIRIDLAVRKINEWYVGDGWYADGPRFHFDHYNSYVIQPMLIEILEVLVATGAKFNKLNAPELLEQATKRMQRFGEHLERLIGPDGSYAPIGRSLTYRTAVFQPLGLLAWRKKLPASLPEGQVRAATLAAQRAIFRNPSNFNAKGYLTIGFAGHQPSLGDIYSNAGSMYIAAESLIALGLPATDSYWTAPAQSWTTRKAFAGEHFPKDYYVDY